MDHSAKTPGALAGANSPIMKPWAELTESERIETLRAEIIHNRYLTRRISELEGTLRLLKKHTHDEQGRVCVPVEVVDGAFNGVASMHDRLA